MASAASPDEYLAAVDPERRKRLLEIRRIIQATCPEATESMLYGMPGFRLGKAHLAAYAAAKRHDGFYPCSSQVIAGLPAVQAEFSTSKGAVQLPLDQPVPRETIELLVRTRVAEIHAT